MAQHVLNELDSLQDERAVEIAKKISLLDAVHTISQAWRRVTSATISNCFKKAFTVPDDNNNEVSAPVNSLDNVEFPPGISETELQAIVDQDGFLVTCDEGDVDVSQQQSEEEEEEEEKTTSVTANECLQALATVRQWCKANDVENSVHCGLLEIERQCVRKKQEAKKQCKITDYFKL